MDTVFDFIAPFEDFLTMLNRYGVETADVRYFAAYREYLSMRAGGATYYGSIWTVSESYGIPVGTLRRKIRKFSQRLSR